MPRRGLRCDRWRRACQQAITEVVDTLADWTRSCIRQARVCSPRCPTSTADEWGKLFATHVTGASLVTVAAAPHLAASAGSAVYLSLLSAWYSAPWPLLAPTPSRRRHWTSLSTMAHRASQHRIDALAVGGGFGGARRFTDRVQKAAGQPMRDHAIRFWMDEGYMQAA